MNGFYGRILDVDLDSRRFRIETVSDDVLKTYLGGKGLGSHLLYAKNPAGMDPLDGKNVLIFATGPTTGSAIWGGCRYGVFTKSPLTGMYSESYSGGRVPEAIDAAGFDAVIIRGKSSVPLVLSIYPGGPSSMRPRICGARKRTRRKTSFRSGLDRPPANSRSEDLSSSDLPGRTSCAWPS